MGYKYSGILFSHKNECSSEMCHNMDEPEAHDGKLKKSVAKEHTQMYVMSKIGKSTETKSRFVVVSGWEVGEMEVTVLGDRICLRDDKSILELDSCDDCISASQVSQWLRICLPMQETQEFDPCVGKISWRRKWQLTPVSLPGKSHGQRSVMGYSPRGHKKLDTTEHAYTMIVQYCVRMKCHGIMCFKIKW